MMDHYRSQSTRSSVGIIASTSGINRRRPLNWEEIQEAAMKECERWKADLGREALEGISLGGTAAVANLLAALNELALTDEDVRMRNLRV